MCASAHTLALRETTRGRAIAKEFGDVAARQLAADCLALAAVIRQRQDNVRAALRCRQVLAEGEHVGAVAACAHARSVVAWAGLRLGWSDAEESERRAFVLYEEAGDLGGQANSANNLGIHAYYDGRWTETVEMYRRSRDAAHGSATSSTRP